MYRCFHGIGNRGTVRAPQLAARQVWQRPLPRVAGSHRLFVPAAPHRKAQSRVYILVRAHQAKRSRGGAKDERIPTLVVSGFLNSGKTALTSHLLASTSKVAFIVDSMHGLEYKQEDVVKATRGTPPSCRPVRCQGSKPPAPPCSVNRHGQGL